MKIWDKGFSIDEKIERFTVGSDRTLDILLAEFDLCASIAHANMLASCGIITAGENKKLVAALQRLLLEARRGTFVIDQSVEDVHSQIEQVLIEQLGDTGKKIHTARSRNDQVFTAIVLFSHAQLLALKSSTQLLFNALLDKANTHKKVLLAGYTHTQMAMPSSFGLWFGGYAEMLAFDMEIIAGISQAIHQNPLGSAAGYGSSFPINREMTTKALGFQDLMYSSTTPQMLRGKLEWSVLNGLSSLALTLNKLATDICLFNSQNFGFLHLPKEFTTGSSIMPHKKNPDVFELVRAKTNALLGKPNEIALIISNLMSGYHRDFQATKDIYFGAWKEMFELIDIMTHAIRHLEVNTNILSEDKYQHLFTVENVATLVKQGCSFRDAYKKVAEDIASGTYTPEKKLTHTHTGSISQPSLPSIKKKFDRAVQKIK